jgi:hypothetical protein
MIEYLLGRAERNLSRACLGSRSKGRRTNSPKCALHIYRAQGDRVFAEFRMTGD